jgi:flagellar biosynthesis/type III secretory pathway protein FliH
VAGLAKIDADGTEDLADLAVQPPAKAKAVAPLSAPSETPAPEAQGVASSVEADAYAKGRELAQGISAVQKKGFATGLGDGIREGQAENAEFFRECLDSAKDAFTFGG